MTKKEIEEEIKRVKAEMKELKAGCIKYVLNNAEIIAEEMLFPPESLYNDYDDSPFGGWAGEMQELQAELEELEERLNEDEEDEEEDEEEEDEE